MSLLEELSAILRLPMLRQPITQLTSSDGYLATKRTPFYGQDLLLARQLGGSRSGKFWKD
jgi:hypothetical protein